MASFNQNISLQSIYNFYSVKTSSKRLNGATWYTGFIISLLVIPSFSQCAALPLGPRQIVHNDKIQANSRSNLDVFFNEEFHNFSVRWRQLIWRGYKRHSVYFYRAWLNDVTLVDVGHIVVRVSGATDQAGKNLLLGFCDSFWRKISSLMAFQHHQHFAIYFFNFQFLNFFNFQF